MSKVKWYTRRSLLLKTGIMLNGLVGVTIAAPIIRYLLSPIEKSGDYNSWISLGQLNRFPEGQTRIAEFESPSQRPQDGQTAKTSCWVRRVGGNTFQVFAINCAHLGCPVRWFPQSELFMCPCHGGAYYADGSRASGPPERGLFEYEYMIVRNELHINAGQMPTLANQAMFGKEKSPCLG